MNVTSRKYKTQLFQPALEWSCIALFILLTAALALTGGGKLLNLLFPVASVVLGLLLYARQKLLYNGFIWWLLFLSSFVRRISDYYGSYTEPSSILLAPFLVVSIAGVITVSNLLRSPLKAENSLYLMTFSGMIYAFLIGLINHSFFAVSIKSLDYFIPVIYSFYIFSNWKEYPQFRRNTLRVFLWGVLIMGAYGLFQFIFAPEWDTQWLLNSTFVSGGRPIPFGLNVWSTMKSNRPFGTVIGAGLVLLLINKNVAIPGIFANTLGYISLLLARKRTTWMSWLLSVFFLGKSLNLSKQVKLILTLIFFSGALYFIISLSPFSDFVFSRFDTFSNLGGDHSAEVRKESFDQIIGYALTNVTGDGLGGKSFDSGIVSLLLDLGWIGLFPYSLGITFLFLKVFKSPLIADDSFALAARAIALSTVLQIPLGRPYEDAQGMVLWGFLGFSLAAIRHANFCKRQAALIGTQSNRLLVFQNKQ